MTDIKLDSRIRKSVADALEGFAPEMFAKRAGRWMAVVELVHVERTEPGEEEDKEATVKIGVCGIEIAADDVTDERLRQQRRSMYDQRTRSGTLYDVA